eukprot:TRINITY_DN90366_c0_g1_i1.p1 TRINITY_DN90366_c0_g1~~TRINITY_DN90366_c0_g1_i1.p1  ORF type:complete len:543 (-),score=175.66 TRINITY_DN90366_c0_g1_i1:115-1743(-)
MVAEQFATSGGPYPWEKSDVHVSSAQEDPTGKRRDTRAFRLNPCSETYLLAVFPDGQLPGRKAWNLQEGQSRLTSTQGLFRLKPLEMPPPKAPPLEKGERRSSKRSGGMGLSKSTGSLASATTAASGFSMRNTAFDSFLTSAGFTDHIGKDQVQLSEFGGVTMLPHAPPSKPKAAMTRAERYFEALMKAHRKRDEEEAKRVYEGQIAKATAAAEAAQKRMILAEKPPTEPNSDDEDEDDDEKTESSSEEEEDPGPLQAYDGCMSIDIEVVVMNAPGIEEIETPSNFSSRPSSSGSFALSEKGGGRRAGSRGSQAGSSGTRSSARSSEVDEADRIDIAAELAALTEEVGGLDKEESEPESEGLPEGLSMAGGMDSIYSADDPRLTLGIGGTCYFVPEAERYALCPSLPPPPPASLLGRRRIRLKPRLPLDISHGRWIDEHPNIFPGGLPPSVMTEEDRARLETTICTYDFYVAATKALFALPKQQRRRDIKKQKRMFGEMIEKDIAKSAVWRRKLKREFMTRKKEEQEAMKAKSRRASQGAGT